MAIEEHASPIYVLISAFFLSSLAGLAAMLRQNQKISILSVVSAMLNAGILGLCIAGLYVTQFSDNIYALISLCCLAGLGGSTAIDFVLTAVKKGGLSISINKDGNVKMGEGEKTNDNK